MDISIHVASIEQLTNNVMIQIALNISRSTFVRKLPMCVFDHSEYINMQ